MLTALFIGLLCNSIPIAAQTEDNTEPKNECGDLCLLCKSEELTCEICEANASLSSESGVCECNSGFYRSSNSCLLNPSKCDTLCQECTSEGLCISCKENAFKADGNTCICMENYTLEAESCVPLICDELCMTCEQSECDICTTNAFKNSISGKCECQEGFIHKENSCVLSCDPLCIGCQPGNESFCEKCVANAEKIKDLPYMICQCMDGYVQVGSSCEREVLNGCDFLCEECDSTCKSCVSNAYMDAEGHCQCESSYVQSGFSCIFKSEENCGRLCQTCDAARPFLCFECTDNAFKANPWNSLSSCECEEGYTLQGPGCVPSVIVCGALCSDCSSYDSQTCTKCIENASIVDNDCQCNQGYSKEGNVCVKDKPCGDLCLMCDESEDSNCAMCVPNANFYNGECFCKENFVQVGKSCEVSLCDPLCLGCHPSDTSLCLECTDNAEKALQSLYMPCFCKPGYYQVENSCVERAEDCEDLCDKCDAFISEFCFSCVDNAYKIKVSETSYQCFCEPGFESHNNLCVKCENYFKTEEIHAYTSENNKIVVVFAEEVLEISDRCSDLVLTPKILDLNPQCKWTSKKMLEISVLGIAGIEEIQLNSDFLKQEHCGNPKEHLKIKFRSQQEKPICQIEGPSKISLDCQKNDLVMYAHKSKFAVNYDWSADNVPYHLEKYIESINSSVVAIPYSLLEESTIKFHLTLTNEIGESDSCVHTVVITSDSVLYVSLDPKYDPETYLFKATVSDRCGSLNSHEYPWSYLGTSFGTSNIDFSAIQDNSILENELAIKSNDLLPGFTYKFSVEAHGRPSIKLFLTVIESEILSMLSYHKEGKVTDMDSLAWSNEDYCPSFPCKYSQTLDEFPNIYGLEDMHCTILSGKSTSCLVTAVVDLSTKPSENSRLVHLFVLGILVLSMLAYLALLRYISLKKISLTSETKVTISSIPQSSIDGQFPKKYYESDSKDTISTPTAPPRRDLRTFLRNHLVIGQLFGSYITSVQRGLLLFTAVFLDFALAGLATQFTQNEDWLIVYAGFAATASIVAALITIALDLASSKLYRWIRYSLMSFFTLVSIAGSVVISLFGRTSGWFIVFGITAAVDLFVIQTIYAGIKTIYHKNK